MPNSRVCVDSNLVLKLAVDEEDSEIVRSQWERWIRGRTQLVAPELLWCELTSALRQKVIRGVITDAEAKDALSRLLSFQPLMTSVRGEHQAALDLAIRHDRPQAYDSHYLAVAEALDCPLWTADRRLYNAVKDAFPTTNLVG